MHRIKWIDGKAEPQNPANPRYPDGIDLDVSKGADRVCLITLPYPARRLGYFDIECMDCGLTVAISTAGRVDDPRSVKVACKGHR